MNPLSVNGSAVVAMTGKDCVAIACDKRFGMQAQTIAMDFSKVFEVGPHLYVGLPGLATDLQTVHQRLMFRVNMYELSENRRVRPNTLLSMLSNLLYEKRFGPYFVEPIVAGLDQVSKQPFVASLDLIGCPMKPDDFVVAGTCAEQLYGMCETLWEPEMDANMLFEKISQALMNAVDRDALSGWGGIVHIIEKDKVTMRELKCRMD